MHKNNLLLLYTVWKFARGNTRNKMLRRFAHKKFNISYPIQDKALILRRTIKLNFSIHDQLFHYSKSNF